jgi:two-component system response regulator WspF
MKIAIVNDVRLAVEALRRAVATAPEHEVIWTAYDGAEAVQRARMERPDLILMDLIMPVMDGVEATRRIMIESPCPILVVTATVQGNAGHVYEAMAHGALDAVNTPTLDGSGGVEGSKALLEKIATIGRLFQFSTPRPVAPSTNPSFDATGGPLVAIGSSTGGPQALAAILSLLPGSFSIPIVVIQHVDAAFAGGLASWLSKETPLDVRIAQPGDRPTPGIVLLAGRNDHLVLHGDGTLGYDHEPSDTFYWPSVDVFYHSVAEKWRGPVMAALLTGMGRDGAAGMLELWQRGATTIAQDEKSCVVFGMPKAACDLGAAAKVLGLEGIAREFLSFAKAKTP